MERRSRAPYIPRMELGLCSFVENTPDPLTGAQVSGSERMRDLLEEAELADQLGLDVFAIGEHHRPDFLASAPAVVLAAIASRTRRLRLSSAVTVLARTTRSGSSRSLPPST